MVILGSAFSTYLLARRLISVIAKGRSTVGWPTRQCCRGVERIRAGGPAETFLSLARSYLPVGTGARRGRWSLPRPKARKGPYRKVKRKKGRKRVVGKAAGDERALIPGRASGWQEVAGSDAIPDAAGGEGRIA
jgi:hypothetical protein